MKHSCHHFPLQDIRTSRKRMKLSPLERGWSGNKMAGRSCGAPDPNGYGEGGGHS